MKTRSIFLSASLLALLCACSAKESKLIEQGEGDAAAIEAAAMEGRRAARPFLKADPTDTALLHGMLLDVRARQSKYVVEKKHTQAEAFDTAFVHTLRAVNPAIAAAVEASPAQ